jgi:hypothetical protein
VTVISAWFDRPLAGGISIGEIFRAREAIEM